MPGLVGHFSVAPEAADVGRGLRKLEHLPGYRTARFSHGPAVQVGRVVRANRDPAVGTAMSRDRAVSVHLTGHLRRTTEPFGDITAADVLDSYLRGSWDPNAADGGFVCCIVDLNRRRLQLCNDRLGALPLMYASNARGFAFAPEVKAILPTLGMSPRFTDRGVVSFLTAGYCLGDETLFENVSCLTPGSVLTVDLDSLAVNHMRYWRMAYVEDQAFGDRRAASAVLAETICRAHDSLLGVGDSPFDILLSGGLDSRCMLACVVRAGHKPKRALSWGARDDIPYSDPHIAASLARHFGVPFGFFPYGTEQFIENAAAWSYVSELANDNMGWYAEGTGMLLDSYDPLVDFTLVGDQAWGYGGNPTTRDDVIAGSMPPAVAPALLRLARPQFRETAQELYAGSVDRVLNQSRNDALADQKDYFHLQGRTPRFLYSLGSYKELATEIRRPFLTKATLDIVRRLPAHFRYNKNLYRYTLLRHFPELRGFPVNIVSSLPDWTYDIRTQPALRAMFSDLLSRRKVEASALSQWLDPAAIEQASQQCLASPVRPISRKPGRLALLRYRLIPERVEILRDERGMILSNFARSDLDFFRTVALLVLFEGQLPDLAR